MPAAAVCFSTSRSSTPLFCFLSKAETTRNLAASVQTGGAATTTNHGADPARCDRWGRKRERTDVTTARPPRGDRRAACGFDLKQRDWLADRRPAPPSSTGNAVFLQVTNRHKLLPRLLGRQLITRSRRAACHESALWMWNFCVVTCR